MPLLTSPWLGPYSYYRAPNPDEDLGLSHEPPSMSKESTTPIVRSSEGHETIARPFPDREDDPGLCRLFIVNCMVGVGVVCAAAVVAAIMMGLLYGPKIVVMMIMIERNRAH
ncbi:hypothetical protein BDW67DRAFT_181370 [Aspergillus spinulosporus]